MKRDHRSPALAEAEAAEAGVVVTVEDVADGGNRSHGSDRSLTTRAAGMSMRDIPARFRTGGNAPTRVPSEDQGK